MNLEHPNRTRSDFEQLGTNGAQPTLRRPSAGRIPPAFKRLGIDRIPIPRRFHQQFPSNLDRLVMPFRQNDIRYFQSEQDGAIPKKSNIPPMKTPNLQTRRTISAPMDTRYLTLHARRPSSLWHLSAPAQPFRKGRPTIFGKDFGAAGIPRGDEVLRWDGIPEVTIPVREDFQEWGPFPEELIPGREEVQEVFPGREEVQEVYPGRTETQEEDDVTEEVISGEEEIQEWDDIPAEPIPGSEEVQEFGDTSEEVVSGREEIQEQSEIPEEATSGEEVYEWGDILEKVILGRKWDNISARKIPGVGEASFEQKPKFFSDPSDFSFGDFEEVEDPIEKILTGLYEQRSPAQRELERILTLRQNRRKFECEVLPERKYFNFHQPIYEEPMSIFKLDSGKSDLESLISQTLSSEGILSQNFDFTELKGSPTMCDVLFGSPNSPEQHKRYNGDSSQCKNTTPGIMSSLSKIMNWRNIIKPIIDDPYHPFKRPSVATQTVQRLSELTAAAVAAATTRANFSRSGIRYLTNMPDQLYSPHFISHGPDRHRAAGNLKIHPPLHKLTPSLSRSVETYMPKENKQLSNATFAYPYTKIRELNAISDSSPFSKQTAKLLQPSLLISNRQPSHQMSLPTNLDIRKHDTGRIPTQENIYMNLYPMGQQPLPLNEHLHLVNPKALATDK